MRACALKYPTETCIFQMLGVIGNALSVDEDRARSGSEINNHACVCWRANSRTCAQSEDNTTREFEVSHSSQACMHVSCHVQQSRGVVTQQQHT
jgi:hypothetical protein